MPAPERDMGKHTHSTSDGGSKQLLGKRPRKVKGMGATEGNSWENAEETWWASLAADRRHRPLHLGRRAHRCDRHGPSGFVVILSEGDRANLCRGKLDRLTASGQGFERGLAMPRSPWRLAELCGRPDPKERTLITMTDKASEVGRLMKVTEAVVAELERQGVAEALANLGFDPIEMAQGGRRRRGAI